MLRIIFLLQILVGGGDLVSGTPIIYGFNKTAVLFEGTTVNQVLSTIECGDPDGDLTDARVQSVSPSSPCTNCFEVLDCGANECLQYRAGVGTLRHATTASYLVTVACEDNVDIPATEVIEVIVAPSSPPFFDPDIHFVDASLNVSLVNVGDVIYDVNATDNENEDITYTLAVSPVSASGAFSINSVSGEITAIADLTSLCLSSVTLEVFISDGTNTPGPLVINMPLTNSRVAPVAINLNREVHIPEDAATGTIYSMRFVDGDGDALTYSVTSTNTAGLAQYSLSGDEIDVAAALDYETSALRITDLTVKASDDYCTSEEYSLRLEVTDVNEAPTISPTKSTVMVCEGKSEFDSGVTLADPDAADTHKWTLVSINPDGYYSINPDTGALRTAINYDVDPDYNITGAHPQSYEYIIKSTDKGGLTATATVTATFLDCNDNAPRFLQPAYSASATECTTPGTILLNLEAEDADSSRQGNNDIYFTGSSGSLTVGAEGAVTLVSTHSAGTVITFNAYAWDKGQTPGPLRSAMPAKVSVRFLPCPPTNAPATAAPATVAPTTTTTTTTTLSYKAGGSNAAWVAVGSLLAVCFLGLLTYMLWRYWSMCSRTCETRNCCRREPRYRERRQHARVNRPPSEGRETTPPPPQPGFLFGFWKERYPNDDFQSQPKRNQMPTPGDMEVHQTNTVDPVTTAQQDSDALTAQPRKKFCTIL